MATIENKKIVDELIANDGEFHGDPSVQYIVEYETLEGKIVYAICYSEMELLGCLDSPYCRNQRMLFRKSGKEG